jgi:uncharacterized MAPEG superfamily protein
MTPLSPELIYTAAAAAFTGLFWIPVVLNRVVEIGLGPTLQNPVRDSAPKAAWAFRLAAAHRNAIENLVVFAPLALIVHVAGLGTGATALASAAFFWSRVGHALVYAAGIPVLRTLAFLVSFAAEAYLALRVFNLV